jgi:hypothetical protein
MEPVAFKVYKYRWAMLAAGIESVEPGSFYKAEGV